MTIDEALFAYLTSPTTQTGQILDDRLYPLNLPQDPTYRAATYQQIDAGLTATGQTQPGDLEEALYQFDCYALTPNQARALAAALRADLSGYKGLMSGVKVGACHFQKEYDFWGATAGVWRRTLEFKLLFNVQ